MQQPALIAGAVGAPARAAEPASPSPTGRVRRTSGRGSRRRGLKLLRLSHRWLSLAAGLVLVVITSSGAILVLEPDLRVVLHPGQFHHTTSRHPVSSERAISAATRAYPHAGPPSELVVNRGVDQIILDGKVETLVSVDPGTGRVLGSIRPDRGILGFVANLHECGLTCSGYAGYVPFLTHDMPGLGVPGLHRISIGDFILGCFACLLGLLVLSGVVLWWPGISRWRRGFQVRAHKGPYARDYDLHKLIGIVALPMLAMWALTGANFQLPVVSEVVYAVIGDKPAPTPTFASVKVPAGTPQIGAVRAEAIALGTVPHSTFRGVDLPTPGDPTSTYLVWESHGSDPERDGDFPGNVGVAVDQHTGAAKVLYGQPGRPLRQTIWNDWTTGVHYGSFMGWIPRLLWVGFGLAPLALMITGLSTWLRRGTKKRRARRMRRVRSVAG